MYRMESWLQTLGCITRSPPFQTVGLVPLASGKVVGAQLSLGITVRWKELLAWVMSGGSCHPRASRDWPVLAQRAWPLAASLKATRAAAFPVRQLRAAKTTQRPNLLQPHRR